MSKHKRPFDQNLVDAINKLCWPLVNNNGIKVFLRNNARYESGVEHIAGKLHELKVRDIELLPNILKQPLSVKTDKRKGKLYFGRRKGVNKGFNRIPKEIKDRSIVLDDDINLLVK